MGQLWVALAGAVAGTFLTLITSLIQQRRLWRREDSLRRELWKHEIDKENNALAYKSLQKFLASANRINAVNNEVRILLLADFSKDSKEIAEARSRAAVYYAEFQDSMTAYLLVKESEPVRRAMAKLTRETLKIRTRIVTLDSGPVEVDDDNDDFKHARRVCEDQISRYLGIGKI